MADTEKKAAETGTNGVNGVADDEVVLMTEEELEKAKMRPADIDQDMKEMERRKRVENIMNSALFREELERIIETQIQEGYTGYQTLQNISEMIGIPASRASMFKGSQSAIPINDIRGMESLNFAKGEKIIRCKLASIYRLIDIHGWSQSIYNHCTARVSQDSEHFLLNPFGMLYHEITAASLVKVDMQGNVLDPGSTNFGVNVAGFLLHSAIHASRPDIKCVVHLHHPAVVAVSAFKDGLLPLSQESLLLGDVSYHDYCGIFVNPEEKEKLARNLGPINKIMFLRNHGVVCCGETVEETWYNTYHTVLACETQMRMAPMGFDNLILVSEEARQQAYDTAHRGGGGGVDSKQEGGVNQQGTKERKFRVGDVEFEALMRTLDNGGLRTGYIYRRPLIKSEHARLQSDVAFPPAASNYTHLFDEDDLTRSPLKRILDGRKAQDKSRWLNSPNTYSKVEVLETGTPDPKKITKWVADDSPTHATSVKLEDNLMFVPKYTDPKEFKRIQKMIKENRRIGNISAGPTSHLLEGVTWEEARRMQDATMSSTGDHVILVGAASKGIIQREFQHNAVVYKTPYSKNPFDAISDQELEDYKQTVERKQRGEPEEIEIEQMNITPQVATRDVVDDSNQVMSPMSPLSDDDASSARQLQFETKMAPRASKAQSVIVSDDGNVRQKPVVPPKPNIPKSSLPQGAIAGSYTSPQKVQTSMKVLPQRDCPSPDGRFSSADSSTTTTPKRASSHRATLPRAPGNKTNHETMRTNSLSRGLAKMLKLSRSKDDDEKEGLSLAELVRPDVTRVNIVELQIPHFASALPVTSQSSTAQQQKNHNIVTQPTVDQNSIPSVIQDNGSVTYKTAGLGYVTYDTSEEEHINTNKEQVSGIDREENCFPLEEGLFSHQCEPESLPNHAAIALASIYDPQPLHCQLAIVSGSYQYEAEPLQQQLDSELLSPPKSETLPQNLVIESILCKHQEEPMSDQLAAVSLPFHLKPELFTHKLATEPVPHQLKSVVSFKDESKLEPLTVLKHQHHHHLKSELLTPKTAKESFRQHLSSESLKGQLELKSLSHLPNLKPLPQNHILAEKPITYQLIAESLPHQPKSELSNKHANHPSSDSEWLPHQSDTELLSYQPKLNECPGNQLSNQSAESSPQRGQLSPVQPRDELVYLMLTQLNQSSIPSLECLTKNVSERSETKPSNKIVTSRSPRKQQFGRRKVLDELRGDALANGEETEAHHSTLSHSSKEGSPTKDTSLTDDSISKDKKKKKKGLRTPSFLKKKKDKKKEKEAALQS